MVSKTRKRPRPKSSDSTKDDDDNANTNTNSNGSTNTNGSTNDNGNGDSGSNRIDDDDQFAECPFTVTVLRESAKSAKFGHMRRPWKVEGKLGSRRAWAQEGPFLPAGNFKSNDSMDTAYVVDPDKDWMDMTRYNSFVLNGSKFFVDDFVYVANDRTLERPAKLAKIKNNDGGSIQRPDDHWVAKVLEIRAADEHHVYARIYWMYWPDELPAGLMGGMRTSAGRQPYHGRHELVASNHMDIINVFSVATAADVKQWNESDDDVVQDALYWRQALDCRSMELSTVETICSCGLPANPDKLIIECTNRRCRQWMHHDCLRLDALSRTYEKQGASTKDGLGIKKRAKAEKAKAFKLLKEPTSSDPLRSGPFGRFNAKLRYDDGPTLWEITDKKSDVTWTEQVLCLLCGSAID